MTTRNKLALGTVQFGLNYGISNTNGQVCLDEVISILSYAQSVGINILDTAQGYGESESILGHCDLSEFNIITKIIGNGNLEDSLNNMNVSSIYGVMFHRENEINEKRLKIFQSYKEQKLVQKIGISVYCPDTLFNIMNKYPIDMVQIPFNMLDQRFLPMLPQLKKNNIEIYTRSIFLQGLLLMEEIPSFFKPIELLLGKLPRPKLNHALNCVKHLQEVDNIVVGCTSLLELQQIVNAYYQDIPIQNYTDFAITEEKYINPSQWEIQK